MRRTRRRGLSEILGAFMLVVIMIGVTATIYTAHMKARSMVNEAAVEARRSLMIAANPPTVDTAIMNGSVYIIVYSDIKTDIEAVIVKSGNGSVKILDVKTTVSPGGPATIKVMDACQPFRVTLLLEEGVAFTYPKKGYYCSGTTSSQTTVDPATGKTLHFLVAPAPSDPLNGSLLYEGSFSLEISGRVSRYGPTRLTPLRVYLNETEVGVLSPTNHRVYAGSVGPASIVVWDWYLENAYVIGLTFETNGSIVYVSVNSSLSYSASSSRPLSVCDELVWLAPITFGPIITNMSVDGVCIYPDTTVGYVSYGSMNATGAVVTSGPTIIFVTTGSSAAFVSISYNISFKIYIINYLYNNSVEINNLTTPINLTLQEAKPLIGNPPGASNKWLSINLTRLVSPVDVTVEALLHGTLLGEWSLSTVEDTLTLRSANIPVSLRITAKRLLPATNLQWLDIDVTLKQASSTYTYEISGTVKELNSPQPWAFPLVLDLSGPVESSIVIAPPSPVTEVDPVDSLFPYDRDVEALSSGLTVMEGVYEVYGYAATVYTGKIVSYNGSVPIRLLEDEFGYSAFLFFSAETGSIPLPGGLTMPVYRGLVVWVN